MKDTQIIINAFFLTVIFVLAPIMIIASLFWP